MSRAIYTAEIEATTVEEVYFQLPDGAVSSEKNIKAQAKATFLEGVNGHVVKITSLRITEVEEAK